MHARELIELAALVSVHGPVLARTTGRISEKSIEQYWTASKSRLDRWGRTLKCLSNEIDGEKKWPQLRGVLEEILTGEVLTRVWTAVMVAYDRRRGTDQGEPIARSVLIGHLEARHRVLTLLVRGPRIDAEQAVKLDRLRRRTERWTDLLIGYLMGLDDVGQFALDPDRARDFAEDLSYQSRMRGGRFAWPLLLASLRAAFGHGLGPTSPNGDLNAKIAVSILSSFPPEVFDALGLFRSAWLVRMTNVTADAEGMIDALLALGNEASTDDAGSTHGRRLDHLRRFGK
ncbi:MAG: hypothetical protein ABIK89_08385 [Planctomycetota bacterium]